jgi:hypothetical protein
MKPKGVSKYENIKTNYDKIKFKLKHKTQKSNTITQNVQAIGINKTLL